MNGAAWWALHKTVFKSVRDPVIAASIARDWLDNVSRIFPRHSAPMAVATQQGAAMFQQSGSWAAIATSARLSLGWSVASGNRSPHRASWGVGPCGGPSTTSKLR
jgi:hypothetical protein